MGVRENEKEISNPDECGFSDIHCDTFRLYCLGYLFCCCWVFLLFFSPNKLLWGLEKMKKDISNPDECGFSYIHCDTFWLYCLGYLFCCCWGFFNVFFTKQSMMVVRENDKKRFQLETNVVFRIYIVTHLGYIVWVTCCFVVFLICLGFFTKQFQMGVRENEKEISNPDECGFSDIHCDTFRLYCLGYLYCCCWVFLLFFSPNKLLWGLEKMKKDISNPDECGFSYIHCDTFWLYCLGYLFCCCWGFFNVFFTKQS